MWYWANGRTEESAGMGRHETHRRNKTPSGRQGSRYSGEDRSTGGAGTSGDSPAEQCRRQAICDLFGAWGRHDPQAALLNAAQLPPDEVEVATGHALSSWARKHPEEAAAWLKACPSPSPNHLRDVFLAWPDDAKTSAQAWFDSLPDSPARPRRSPASSKYRLRYARTSADRDRSLLLTKAGRLSRFPK